MTPYHKFVSESASLIQAAKSYPLGGFAPASRPNLPADAPKALFFAPHPDDETIVGGLALRLMREAPMNLINVAVTLGSKKDRQAERFRELQAACDFLGYGLLATCPSGLERINPATREKDPSYWANCVRIIAEILKANEPRIIFFPHEQDRNTTHLGTNLLVLDALKSLPGEFETYVVETEFWGQLVQPNLMVEISSDTLADMIAATTFHVGEVQRNPYHLLLPAWMMDNVRRGSESVGAQGGAAPDFMFAALYRLRKWRAGRLIEVQPEGKVVPASASVGELFP